MKKKQENQARQAAEAMTPAHALPLICQVRRKRQSALHLQALGEAVDVDSEAYCWHESRFFLKHHLPVLDLCLSLHRM